MKRPEDLFRDVMQANPKGSQKEHRDALWGIVSEDVTGDLHWLEMIFDQWFAGRYAHRVITETETGTVFESGASVKGPVKTGFTPGPEPTTDVAAERKNRAAKKRRQAERAQRLAEQFKARTLLNWILPDGTLLRHATAAKCRRAGGWLVLVAKRMKRGQVGTQFSEAQLHALWKQANGSNI